MLAAAERRSEALVSKDLEALSLLLHPNFVYVDASGQVLDREQYFDLYVRPEEVQWASQVIDAPVLADGGTVAVLTCLVHDVAHFGNQNLDETFRSTFTWIQTDRGWQCLAGHTSRLQQL